MRLRPAVLAVLAAGLAACQPNLSIAPDRHDYAPVLSSVPGLGLSPASRVKPPAGVRWHWRTDFGQFLRWEPPAYKVEPLGQDVPSAAKVYWTYDPQLMHQTKPPVTITLTAEDPGGRPLAAARLRLKWDGDAAELDR